MATAKASLLLGSSPYSGCFSTRPTNTTTTCSRSRPWQRSSSVLITTQLILTIISIIFVSPCAVAAASADTMASSLCNGSTLPNPPSPSNLISFLQQLQTVALSVAGSNSSSFDPKTYVDLPLRYPLNVTSTAFQGLLKSADGGTPSSETFQEFVKDYFYEAGSDLVVYIPPDFVAEPTGFLPHVQDGKLRAWALKVHAIWLELSRKVAPNVADEPDQHTLLPLPNPVIVPGSRFREVYYWDSYWIIRGLLVSKMFQTAKGMVENLLYLVKVYGFVLNGARAYYENRSQPPLLSAMVRELYLETNDTEMLEKALPLLIHEHKYWTSGSRHVVIIDGEGRKHSLSRYSANWKAPRPESFTIDMQVAEGVPKSKQELLYYDIASAAESGWDFGSRWMRDEEHLSTLFTTSIVPADLNAYIFQMEVNIAFFAKTLGNEVVASKYGKAAQARRRAIQSIMWNDKMGHWLDYILDPQLCEVQLNKTLYIFSEGSQHKIGSASNFIPLWTGILNAGDPRIEKVVDALSQSGLLLPAGIATSLKKTGQQWDFPNAWPPLQHMIIEGLFYSGLDQGRSLATTIAERWIQTNLEVFNETGHMLEKYDATVCGGTGGGGEYILQTGFGWSNGVVLSLLNDLALSAGSCDGRLE